MNLSIRFALAVLLLVSVTGCEKFDAPPQLTLQLSDDASAPLVMKFQEPVKEGTLNFRIVAVKTGTEGELLADADVYFNSKAQELGEGSFNDDRTRYTIQLDASLPVGPPLAFDIEPGLSDDDGNAWTAPQLVEFSFGFECDITEDVPTTFPSATHFLLADVATPLAVQLQLIGEINVDPDSGRYAAQFTNGDRDESIDCAGLGLSCAPEEVCRTLPEPGCVLPSQEALTTDEYPDYIHNNSAVDGYSFTIIGCVRDLPDGSWAFTNEPASVQVPMPAVRVEDIGFNASFAFDEQGVLRGNGSFTAAQIYLGDTPSGAAAGNMRTRSIPPDEVKPGLPPAPEEVPVPEE